MSVSDPINHSQETSRIFQVDCLSMLLESHTFVLCALEQDLYSFHTVATGDFESDELIFSVPRSAVLNLNTVFFGSSSVSNIEFKIRNLASWLVCY